MIKPNKQLGQNFLKNAEIARNIVRAGNIKNSDVIIEIGPGTGILTQELIKTDAKIIAIEKDFTLISKLQKIYQNTSNITLIHQDILWFDLDAFVMKLGKKYKVICNIPYNITSPIIRKFLENPNRPSEMILMVQKEVAERLIAQPGSSARGFLTLIVEYFANAEILFEVSRREFYPEPQVDSAVVKIKIKNMPADNLKDLLFKVIKAGFSQKRKQIHNSLSATFRWTREETIQILTIAQISPELRAEDLKLTDWRKLTTIINELHKK